MMFPGTASASPGQFKKLGSVIFTRATSPRSPVATQCVQGPLQASAHPSATAAKSCRVGDTGSYNTTYVLAIRASGTSCRAARKVIRAFRA